jgi:hypothetical protein
MAGIGDMPVVGLLSRREVLASTAAAAATLLESNKAQAWFPHDTGVDDLAPRTPALELVVASDTGALVNITNDRTPDIDILLGQFPLKNDVITFQDNGVTISTHTITASEALNATFAMGLSPLGEGVHSFSASHSRGGHTSGFSAALNITVDTMAPVLSSQTGVQDNSNDTWADLAVSTNKGDGVWYWVVTTSGTAPTATQIMSGQDNSGSAATAYGRQFVSSTGSKSATATGITSSGTYYAHSTHADIAGNIASVASSSGWTQTPGTGFDVLTTIAPDLWLSASSWLTLWQDTAGTTQATSAGQTAGKWSDKSGHSFDLTATADTAVAKPLYQYSTFFYLQFGGPNPYPPDRSATVLKRAAALGLGNSTYSGNGSTICIAIQANPVTGAYLIGDDPNPSGGVGHESFYNPISSDGVTASTWRVTTRDDNGNSFVNNVAIATGVYDSTWKVLTFIDDGAGHITCRVNGVRVGTYSYNHSIVGQSNGANYFTLGARAYNGPNNYFLANVAEVVIKLNGNMSAGNISKLETYVGSKAGLSI